MTIQIKKTIKKLINLYHEGGLIKIIKVISSHFSKRIRTFIKKNVKKYYFRKKSPLKLHLGCGNIYLKDFINIDIEDWSGICDLVADASNLFMFSENSVNHIFAHALLEHIPPWNTIKTLKEWYRILGPQGTIQIEVPDLERVFRNWLDNRTLNEEEAINNIYGGNKSPDKTYFHQDHLTGFTYDRLTKIMKECGFTNFKRLEHSEYRHILIVCAQKK